MHTKFPIFMDDVPDYEVVHDLMHIRWRELEIVLPVHTMLAGMGQARREIEKWSRRTAKVVSITPCADHAASS
jgi:hypothetical protein